jgi:hypothetical protein
MRKLILLAFALSVLAHAQCNGPCVTPSFSVTSSRPGQTQTLTVILNSQGVLGLQFNIIAEAPLQIGTPMISPALAPKILDFNTANGATVIVGITAAAKAGNIPVGPIATVPISIPAGATSGTVSVSLVNPVGADATGSAILMSAGPPASLTITGAPPPPPSLTLTSLSCVPLTIVGGKPDNCIATMSGLAPTGGVIVNLSKDGQIAVPSSITVPGGSATGTFTVTTNPVTANSGALVVATYNNGTPQQVNLTLVPRSEIVQGIGLFSPTLTRPKHHLSAPRPGL